MAIKEKSKCFVIMPFSKTNENHTQEYWDKHFNEFLKPLIETNRQITAERSRPLRVDVVRQIIVDLVTAPIVVANLTDANPNVFWELGVRTSFKHCTVTIAESNTTLPSDIATKGTLFYEPENYIQMEAFKKNFLGALQDCLENPHKPDSPVLETISGRGNLYQVITHQESIRKLEAVLFEIKSNISTMKVALTTCKKNIEEREAAKTKGEKPPTSFKYLPTRFHIVAVETLLVNRYVDAESSLYDTANGYMDWAISVNEQLGIWRFHREDVEGWLIKVEEPVKAIMEQYRETIKKQKAILESIV